VEQDVMVREEEEEEEDDDIDYERGDEGIDAWQG